MSIIDSKILREKIKDNSIRIVDVRREQDYQLGHITNAVNLPLAKLCRQKYQPTSLTLLIE